MCSRSDSSCKTKFPFYINSNDIKEVITVNYGSASGDPPVPVPNGTYNINLSAPLVNPKNDKVIGTLQIYSIATPVDPLDLTKGGVIESKLVFNFFKYNMANNIQNQITTFESNVTYIAPDVGPLSITILSNQSISGVLKLNSNPTFMKAHGKFKISVPSNAIEGPCEGYKIIGTAIIKRD